LAVASLFGVEGAPEADKVNSLPIGKVSLPTPTYSGFLEVTKSKSLHYVFVESMSSDAAKDPVLIWFNGGPGCSSLLGMFQENGPIVVDDNGSIY
jgi:carboxypeptidase C (cathepsin A)